MRCLLAFCILSCLIVGAGLGADDLKVKDNVPMRGKADSKFERFDVLLTTFFDKYKYPGGASLAVGYQGKLLYSRGYGYADRESKKAAHPESVFRICSLSKPITAVAILQLVEKGKLRLDDKVVNVLGLILPRNADDRWRKITIRHLLEHRGGWDTKQSSDPTYLSPIIVREMGGPHPASPSTIIRYVMRQELDFDPGKRFCYSNFGYCLLGRVIERLGRTSYEAHVRQHVLAPLGIKTMRLGRTIWRNRLPNEVRYYSSRNVPAVVGPILGKTTSAPYGGFPLESMDAHGGWVATASDLLRFVNAFDDPKKCKILKPETIETMFARPEEEDPKSETWYAKGWSVQQFGKELAYWHDGAMEGSAAMMVRRPDRISFAVLLNSNESINDKPPIAVLTPALQLAVNYVFRAK